MRGSFTKRGRKCDVTVTKTHLKCTLKNNLGSNVLWSVSLDDILAVQTQSRDNSELNSVVVHYAARGKGHSLTWAKLVLSGDPDLCKELNNSFATTLPERLRPKTFLVVINPNSGSKTAGRIFHKKVAPLLRTCNITFKVYETRGPDDTPNAFQDVDFSELDGVLCVGGDGHYSKVVTALVDKHQESVGADVKDPDAELRPLPFPVGVIPGGSGNYIPFYLHGSRDPLTAAIKVVLGNSTPTNIVAVHQGGKLEGYCGLICGFGLFGDMMYSCERTRWMGNLRYTVMPLKRIFSRRLIDVTVELQPESGSGDWQTISGSVYSVDTGVVDLADRGAKLVPVFGDSAMTVHLASQCPLGHHIKQLSKVQAWDSGAYDFDFVRTERTSRFRISLPNAQTTTSATGETSLEEHFYLNLDGEALLIHKPHFDVRLHTGVVTLFGTQQHK
ncbi:ceramide kinase [Aplysia californica]|uniref:Ceramide kinase n=1 Tax=Aplysia californica TaxID=6500 RepID=A0ABM1VV95_APLCA|nr:ceramide kinase [Aplysia californica]